MLGSRIVSGFSDRMPHREARVFLKEPFKILENLKVICVCGDSNRRG
jgi:hypothetical protein